MNGIVRFRHPAAFAGSLKRANLPHPFAHFLEQPILMRDHLWRFAEEIGRLAAEDHDIVDQAAALWKLLYFVVAKYVAKHPEWIVWRHEDLSADPEAGFRQIFDEVGLAWADRVEETLGVFTRDARPGERRKATTWEKPLQRNSRATARSWRDRLTADEVKRVRAQVEEVSQAFYSDAEW